MTTKLSLGAAIAAAANRGGFFAALRMTTSNLVRSLFRLECGVLAGADEVGKEAIGAWHAFGKLAVEGEAEVDPRAFAGAGVEQAAELRLLTGVVGFQ